MCKLAKERMFTYVWIPSYLAQKNKNLKIKKDKKWEEGWKVAKVFKYELSENIVTTLSTMYLKQREVSDI
jgi:hypothetical protein